MKNIESFVKRDNVYNKLLDYVRTPLNEIKEDDILCLIECLKSHKINFDYCLNELLDYITNLQEKYEEADNDRHELFERNNKAI